MDYFPGLDVSVRDASVCIVDDTGGIIREVKVASEPDALLAVLTNPTTPLTKADMSGPTLHISQATSVTFMKHGEDDRFGLVAQR